MGKVVAVLNSIEGVNGTISFTQEGDGPTTVSASLSGLKPGLRGFHVHALGDTTNGCMSTGSHYNPACKEHGAHEDKTRHAGDLGNATAGDDGTVNVTIIDKQIPLTGPNSIIGRAVVVHANPDDLGRVQKNHWRLITKFTNLDLFNTIFRASPTLKEILLKLYSAEKPLEIDHQIYKFGSLQYHIQAIVFRTEDFMSLQIPLPVVVLVYKKHFHESSFVVNGFQPAYDYKFMEYFSFLSSRVLSTLK